MYKLEKFNNLYNKLIFLQALKEDKYVQNINNCDAFYRAYILPLAKKYNVISEKQRYNVFRLYGIIQSIYDFLALFKVDKQFMDNSNEFEVLSPMCTFCDVQHYYNNGYPNFLYDKTFSEGNQLIDAGNDISTTRSNDDLYMRKILGRWFNLFDNKETNENVPDFNVMKRVRRSTPKLLIKHLKKLQKCLLIDNDKHMYILFLVNCDKLPNNSFDLLSKDVPITYSNNENKIYDISDIMNDLNKNKLISITNTIKLQSNESLVGDTKQIIRKIKTTNFNTKNKNKTKKK